MKVQIFALALLALVALAQGRWTAEKCPKVDGEEAVSIPNYEDCRTFFKCNAGTPVFQECPTGLFYNAELGVCDYPENVECQGRPWN